MDKVIDGYRNLINAKKRLESRELFDVQETNKTEYFEHVANSLDLNNTKECVNMVYVVLEESFGCIGVASDIEKANNMVEEHFNSILEEAGADVSNYSRQYTENLKNSKWTISCKNEKLNICFMEYTISLMDVDKTVISDDKN